MAGALTAAIAAAFAGSAAPSSDQYFEYTTLLLPGNGTNGAQNNTFLDGSTNNFTITRNGNTTQGTFSPFSQTGWGNYFDGSGDYLTATKNAAYEIGSGDFTVEAWVFPTANGALYNSGILSYGANTSTNGWLFGITGTNFGGTLNRVMFEYNYDGTLYLSTSAVTLNAWNHIAVSRSGSNIYVFLNGNLQTTTSTSKTANTNAGDVSVIGSESYSPSDANRIYTGYISNLRLVKGGALYTSNFTPSTTPLTTTVSSGTVSLLTCQSNRFIDNSTNNFTITRNGDVRVVAFSPFNPTASWSAATYGGSGYFDGNGDYLTVPDNAAFDLPGDFTLEGWFYFTNLSVTNGLIGYGSEAASQNGFSLYWAAGATNKLRIYSNGSLLLTGVTTLSSNSWNHIAVVRSGSGSNNLTVYVNGAVDQTATTTTSFTGVAGLGVGIGVNYDGTFGSVLTGYSTGIRLIKGQALATGAFTPPALPVTTTTVGWNGSSSSLTGTCSLLLNFTNAGIYDATSKNDLETVGNAQISTTQSKWGGSSMAFDGTGDYLLSPDQPIQRIGTGNFTIECWVYRNSSGTYGLVGKGTGTTGWLLSLNSSNQVVFTYGSSTITSTGTVSATTWTYIAVVREGTSTNQTKIYINGSNDGTGTVSTDFNQTNSLYVGADRTGGSNANVYLQDLRITNYARTITASPTAAFPTL